jgi:hypothetical protein
MASWIFVVECNCNDPAHEKEFNDWYNNIHVHELVANDNFIEGTRYELLPSTNPSMFAPASDTKGKYIVVYEIESDSDNIDEIMMKVGQNIKKSIEQKTGGASSPYMKTITRGIYKKIYSHKHK